MTTRQHQQPTNPRRTDHYSGLPHEDQSFLSDDLEEDDSYYVTRLPTSTRRYVPAVIHNGAPPIPRRSSQYPVVKPKAGRFVRRHWPTYMGLFLSIAVIGWLAISILGALWQSKLDDWTYGNPRTYQTDAVVGHGDSAANPSHFIAENLHGQIIVVEYPGGDVSKARSYSITTLPGNDSYPPVRLTFKDVNGDGKPDMVIDIGDPGTQVQIVLFNNGSQFVAKL